MKNRFEKELFESAGFKKELEAYQLAREVFMSNLKDLKEEGLEVSLKAVKKYLSLSDEDWHNLIGGMLKEYIGKLGFVLREERIRIAELYQQLFERTLPAIKSLQTGFSHYGFKLVEVDGIVAIDDAGTEEALRTKYTKEVDTASVEEYYNLVLAVKDALQEIKNFEKRHNLTESLIAEKYYYLGKANHEAQAAGIAIPPRETNIMKYIQEGCSEEVFLEMVASKFIVKKK